MPRPGAPAALQGYRLQALYTLSRVLTAGVDGTQLFQPEGIEDLDIIDQDGKVIELIQVKSYSGLVLSDLEPGKKDSFFDRASKELARDNPPAIKLVNIGTIGPELRRAWEGEEAYQERVSGKLLDSGYDHSMIDNFFESIELVAVAEEDLQEQILAHIREISTGIDPENAFNLFNAWYYCLAEHQQTVSCADLIDKVNDVSRFLAEQYQYHRQWYTSIKPLETHTVDEDRLPQLRQEFYAGVGAKYEHIVAHLDFPREHKISEIFQAFQERNVVIVHAASGQGKTTLGYRYLHDMYPEKWRFAVERVQDIEHAQSIALALSGFATAVGVPVGIYLDVNPRDTDWPELIRQLASHPLLEVLVTVREEDYRRANIHGAGFDFIEVGLDFDQAEAALLYERARSVNEQSDFLDFNAAWDHFGSNGPLMEFVYLLTQTQTLQQRLAHQVQRIEEEVRHGASPDELRLLSLVSLASAYGARLRTRDVINALTLPAPNRTLQQFEQEYLLRRTSEGLYLEGLHPIRSGILTALLIQPDVNPWLEIVAQVLPLILEEDLEIFILHALIDEDHGAEQDDLLDLVMVLRPETWSGIAGVLRSLLWIGAQRYVEDNLQVLDAAYEELGPGWYFGVDLNFTTPGEGPELGEWWTSLGSLIPPERQARLRAIRDRQTPKDTLFRWAQAWLDLLDAAPVPPTSVREWREVATVVYWTARLAPEMTIINWIPAGVSDSIVTSLPLAVLANLSLALHISDQEQHQRWLTPHESVLYQRLAEEEKVLALENVDTTLKIHFVPTGDVEDDSDFLHAETMAKIVLVRRLLPGYQSYGAQGYGFKVAGMELPQGDSTQKDGVPATSLLPEWAIWLNGLVSGIARLRYRLDSWNEYLNMIVSTRRSVVNCFGNLGHGLIKFYRRDKAINLLEEIDQRAWESCSKRLSTSLDLPKSAIDQWGFASESAAAQNLQTLVQQRYVPSAIALQKYKAYLKAQRDYFASVSAFFNQAPPVWVTNAHVGKLHVNDPKREIYIEALKKHDIKANPSLTVWNLFESKAQLAQYQQEFRALFEQSLDGAAISALEGMEREQLSTLWELWYFYAHEPWKGAANPRRQVPQWMHSARQEVRATIQETLNALNTQESNYTLLDYSGSWQQTPTLWVRLDLSDPTDLYAAPENFTSALRDALGPLDMTSLTYYLVRETCEHVVLIPILKGRMLNEQVWPFYTLSILNTEDLQESPWAYFPRLLSEHYRDDLSLILWDEPEILAANALSESVAVLRQLTSQMAEFHAMPDPTEPGMAKLQSHFDEELSEKLSEYLQAFIDSASELLQRFNALSDQEQQERSGLQEAISALRETYQEVIPSEGDGVFQLQLEEIIAYSQRLEKVWPIIEGIRLVWISDALEQRASSDN